jgi:magnesium-transporting ATPase (P-type)
LRISTGVNYFFYKNLIYTAIHMIFTAFNGWSNQSTYPEVFLSAYNILFTAFTVGSLII